MADSTPPKGPDGPQTPRKKPRDGKREGADGDKANRRGVPGFLLILAFATLLYVGWQWSSSAERFGKTVRYGTFLRQLETGNVEWMAFKENGRKIVGQFRVVPPDEQPLGDDEGKPVKLTEKFNANVPATESDAVIRMAMEQPDTKFDSDPIDTAPFGALLFTFLPLLLFLGLFLFLMRRSADPMSSGMFGNFVRSPAKAFKSEEKTNTFADVAGMESAKRELEEVVEFLKTPAKFQRLGAEIPKGVLLAGPPGTGKTLLARATAGEAGVPFFSINGSEFIQMFVGVGASRVRDMFKTAREAAPCILFIDEIDAIGRMRGAGVGGGHDEREQTLNQILSEMDGFSQTEAVIVVGATNRPDVLDPALLRPGRFDRHVTVERPTKAGRLGILKVHSRKVPLEDSVSLEEVASSTIGFSGAELKNLVNEAALNAVREEQNAVRQEDFREAYDKVTLGTPREENYGEREQKMTAYHEAGHALVAWMIPDVDPVHKVSIVPRGRTGGVTMFMPEEELIGESEGRLHGQLAVAMGGRAAEKLAFDELSSGAYGDLRMATRIARTMVGKLGMSEAIGPVAFDQSENDPFLGREMAETSRKYSDETAHAMDREVQRFLQDAQKRAEQILSDNRQKMDQIVDLLMENEVVDEEQLKAVIGDPIERRRGWSTDRREPSTNGQA